jgi:predicted ester cyclase
LLKERTVPITPEQQAIVRRFLEETQNARNLDVVDELVSPVFVGHSEVISGIDAPKYVIQTNLDAFPDLQVTVDDQISSGDTVVTRSSAHETQQSDFHGLQPTGKEANHTVGSVHRLADGQITEGWRVIDRFEILEQLGKVAISI